MEKKPLTVQEFARMGGKASMKNRTKAQRIALAKKAAAARWGKRAKIAMILLLLSLASPLSAQEKTPIRDASFHAEPFIFMGAGQVADIWITNRNFGHGCTEMNVGAFGSAKPSLARLIGVKAAAMAAPVLIAAIMQKTGHQKAARVTAGLVGGIGFGAAAYNLTVNCETGR